LSSPPREIRTLAEVVATPGMPPFEIDIGGVGHIGAEPVTEPPVPVPSGMGGAATWCEAWLITVIL
jgi:hypothetical protein